MSDPAFWDITKGIFSDPNVIPGAFSESDKQYIFQSKTQSILLNAENEEINKQIYLTSDGFAISYHSEPSSNHLPQIPIILDPWKRYEKNWKTNFNYRKDDRTVTFKINKNNFLQINLSVPFSIDSFLDSEETFQKPENPNYDYPAGNLLPYPLSKITLNTNNNYTVIFKGYLQKEE